MVVRVRAGGYLPGTPTRPPAYQDWVRFDVLEVVKGPRSVREVVLQGALVGESDFNERPVPYGMVRAAGQRGSCFAYDYQREGQFLLLLRERDGLLTPYWSALSPTNEQIRGEEDPWLVWVRAQVS